MAREKGNTPLALHVGCFELALLGKQLLRPTLLSAHSVHDAGKQKPLSWCHSFSVKCGIASKTVSDLHRVCAVKCLGHVREEIVNISIS